MLRGKQRLCGKKSSRECRIKIGSDRAGELRNSDERLVIELVAEPPAARLVLRLDGATNFAPSRRTARAAELLLERDARVARKLRRIAPEPLSWLFDPRPGHEHVHDRTLDMVLPLLLSRTVVDDLYPFQRDGVAWLLQNRRSILADDMGLGKTVQVIAALRRHFRNGRIESCLVVAPRTLLKNWQVEARRWAPELVTRPLRHENDRRQTTWRSAVASAHILLASYEEVRQPSAEIIEAPPDIIVADEAHRLRKARSLAHRGLRRIDAPRIWALTGTPVERDAADLAGILSLMHPRRFAVDDHRLGTVLLRARARPYLLRRTKKLVLPELPTAEQHVEEVRLHPAQRHAYDGAVRSFTLAETGGYLPLFSRLLSICDLDRGSGESSKLDQAANLVRAAIEGGYKSVVFSYTLTPLRVLLSRLRAEFGAAAELLTGEHSLQARNRTVQRFKSDPGCWTLLASLRVGGEGLTLTEANRVIFLNRWWNPSTNSQAVDRVVRIGQRMPVTVHYLTCRDTVEERVQPMLDSKEMTFAQLIDALQHKPETVRQLLV